MLLHRFLQDFESADNCNPVKCHIADCISKLAVFHLPKIANPTWKFWIELFYNYLKIRYCTSVIVLKMDEMQYFWLSFSWLSKRDATGITAVVTVTGFKEWSMVENFYSVLVIFLNSQRHRVFAEIFFIRVFFTHWHLSTPENTRFQWFIPAL